MILRGRPATGLGESSGAPQQGGIPGAISPLENATPSDGRVTAPPMRVSLRDTAQQ